MKRLFCALILLVSTTSLWSQRAFDGGEKLTFSASYNMSGLMTELAQVTMETKEVKTSKSTLLHLKCKASTYTKWDSFFKIRDLYEAYVSKRSLLPVLYKRDIYEGGYIKKMKYVYNQSTKTIKSTLNKKNGYEKKKNFSISNEAMDVVSTLYNIRNMDIAKASPGVSKTFSIVFDQKETPVTVTYLGKENVTAGPLGRKECYKLSVSAKSKAMQGKGRNIVYLTADANKVPVLIKFNIAVGSGQLKLKSVQGLAN